MESIEKLRELAMDMNSTEIISHTRLTPPYLLDGDWLDSWHRAFDKACDETEAEIATRYMPLPVDADGVPIRVGDKMELEGQQFLVWGDKMELEGQQFIVCAVAPAVIHSWAAGRKLGEGSTTVGYRPEDCRHVKPRTIEDMLREFASKQHGITTEENDALIAEYADELRRMGVGE